MLKGEISELKKAFNEQFLKPVLQPRNSYASRASTNARPDYVQQISLRSTPPCIPKPITETPYFTIDISGVEPQESDKVTPGGIRTIDRAELEKSAVTKDIRLRAIIRDPQSLHRYCEKYRLMKMGIQAM